MQELSEPTALGLAEQARDDQRAPSAPKSAARAIRMSAHERKHWQPLWVSTPPLAWFLALRPTSGRPPREGPEPSGTRGGGSAWTYDPRQARTAVGAQPEPAHACSGVGVPNRTRAGAVRVGWCSPPSCSETESARLPASSANSGMEWASVGM